MRISQRRKAISRAACKVAGVARNSTAALQSLGLAVGLGCFTSAALAQQAQPAAKAATQERLEEIIVTATKREASLRDIPASIDAYEGAALEAQALMGITEFADRSPGVTVSAGAPSITRITIRGISTDSRPSGDIPRATGILIGDTSFSDVTAPSIQPDLSAFDLASVELLKGPQGTLFGGAALAGAIRYVLREPVIGEWQARGFAQFASPDEGSEAWTHGVAINAPLYSDRLALRLGYVKREYPGTMDVTRTPRRNDVDEGEGDQLRAMLTWQLTDALKAKLTHLEQDWSSPDGATYAADRPDARETSKPVLPQPADHEFTLDSLELNYDFERMRLISLTSLTEKRLYSRLDATESFLPTPNGFPPALAFVSTLDNDSDSVAQELRLQSTAADGLQWLVGLYYYHNEYTVDSVIDSLAHLGRIDATTLFYATAEAEATERAVFFDLSNRFWDRLELSVGARIYSTDGEGGTGGNGVLVRALNAGQPRPLVRRPVDDEGVSPKFSAVYHFTPDLSMYASASRGFRFGGVQGTPLATGSAAVPQTYKSDSLWNYELGLRTSWLQNTLELDITGFYIDYKDPLIAQTTNDAFRISYLDNVSGAVSQGFEVDLRWLTPIKGLVLELDGGITDAHITKAFRAANGTTVQPGAELPGAAESQYSASLSYLVPVGMVDIGSTVGYTYVGKGYSDIVHSFAINDFGTLNAGFSLSSDRWSFKPHLTFSVTNILNETAIRAGARTTSVTGPYNLYVLNPPRTFSARLSVDF